MARAANVEADPFFELLTDALRAGPASPQWHRAVQKLRQDGVGLAGGDEYRLLCDVREHLESGREYRSVRAGPGFTRRLLTGLEEVQAPGGAAPTANVIAALSALAILGVLAVIAVLMTRARGVKPDQPATDLGAMYFPNDVAYAAFHDQIPAGWRPIGDLTLLTDDGLRPAVMPMEKGDYVGGGIVTETPLPPDKPFAVEAVVAIPAMAGDYIAEVFVSDSPDFDTRRATSPREVVWLLEGASEKVMVEGRNEGRVVPVKASALPVTVRVVVVGARAMVETRTGEGASAGEPTRLWSGNHPLAPDKPRYAGVRFIRGAGGSTDVASVRSVRVVTRDAPSGGAEAR